MDTKLLNQHEHQHSRAKSYIAVTILGAAFMLMFIAYNSLQNMISSLYQQLGYHSLGQMAIFGIYIAASIGHFAAAYVLQRVSYKKLMFWCSVLYVIFQLTGLLVSHCKGKPAEGVCTKGIVYSVVIAGSLICGTGASFIWVAQGAYTNQIAVGETKAEMFGLFWGWKSASQIFGAIITTFVLGKLSQMIYFIILCSLGIIGAFSFLFLRPTGKQHEHQNQPKISFKEGVREMVRLICQKGTFTEKLLYIFSGVSLACYTGFLYKLINRSNPIQEGEDLDQYHRKLKFRTGLVLIVLGVSLVGTGVIMNRIKQRINRFRLFYQGTVIVEAAALVSLLTYYLQSYPMCFVCAIFWGASDIWLQSTATAYVAIEYQGKPAAYSVLRTFITIGVASFVLLTIILNQLKIPDYVFMLIVLGFQMIITSFGSIQNRIRASKQYLHHDKQ